MKLNKLLALIAIYLVVLGIRIYWLSQKEGLHLDEGLTVTLSCYNDYMVTRNYNFNTEYNGKEIKEMSLCSDAGIKDVFSDIFNLWKDNRDPPHTNLYYSFLRVSLAGLKTGDINQIIFRGGILNLIFFTISFIFFFLIMKLLFPDSFLLQITATVCAFLSSASISNTLFLRPYQIQETIFIIFCYLVIKSIDMKYLMQNIVNKEETHLIVKQLLLLSFITGITLLTGYYALIYICLFGLLVIYMSVSTKEYKKIIFYISVLILGILIANILYQKYMNGYFSYRAQEVDKIVFSNVLTNIKFSLISFVKLLIKYFYSIPVLAIICILTFINIFYKREKINIQKIPLFILVISLIYSIIVMIIAPYKILRYIMPVFPFLILLPAMIIYKLDKKSKLIASVAMLLLCVSFFINSMNINNIEHTYKTKADQYKFVQNKEIPVVILNYFMWKYPNLIPYLNDEQTYYFIEDYMDIFTIEYPEFYLVIEDYPELRQVAYAAGYNVIEEFSMQGLEPETFVQELAKYYYGMRLINNKE